MLKAIAACCPCFRSRCCSPVDDEQGRALIDENHREELERTNGQPASHIRSDQSGTSYQHQPDGAPSDGDSSRFETIYLDD